MKNFKCDSCDFGTCYLTTKEDLEYLPDFCPLDNVQVKPEWKENITSDNSGYTKYSCSECGYTQNIKLVKHACNCPKCKSKNTFAQS